MAVTSAQANECVRTVRALSDFTIRGDAWLWWSRAEGHYARDDDPAKGAVLVFKRSGPLNRGHVSLVSRVVDSRTIEVDHTWLEGEGLRRHMRVMDVSARGDWSRVRVWHEPSNSWGLRTYPTYGFILPEGVTPAAGPKLEYAVAPSGRGARAARGAIVAAQPTPPSRKPLFQTAALTVPEHPAHAAMVPAAKPVTVAKAMETPVTVETPAPATVIPAVKPVLAAADAKAAPVEAATAQPAITVAVLPGRKPARHADSPQVASAEH